MRETKFRVWCEFELEGSIHKVMEGPASWFLLTQTGHLMLHGLMSFNPNTKQKYKVCIPEFYTGLQYAAFGLSGKRKPVFEGQSKWVWDTLNPQYASSIEVIGNIHENPELLKSNGQ